MKKGEDDAVTIGMRQRVCLALKAGKCVSFLKFQNQERWFVLMRRLVGGWNVLTFLRDLRKIVKVVRLRKKHCPHGSRMSREKLPESVVCVGCTELTYTSATRATIVRVHSQWLKFPCDCSGSAWSASASWL